MSKLEPGTVMNDGSVYAGPSPDSGNMLFVMPQDASIIMTFDEAVADVAALNRDKAFDHEDWRLPTRKELDIIFGNKEKGVLKDTFNEAGNDYTNLGRHMDRREVAGWYRTTNQSSFYTKFAELFKTGDQAVIFNTDLGSVRYVRDGESPGLPAPPPYKTPAHVVAKQNHIKQQAMLHKLVIKPS